MKKKDAVNKALKALQDVTDDPNATPNAKYQAAKRILDHYHPRHSDDTPFKPNKGKPRSI